MAQLFKKVPFHYGWLDAFCHKELLEYFDLDTDVKLPQVIAYYPVRKKFLVMNPRKFTKRNMEKFMRSLVEAEPELPLTKEEHPVLGD
ncbi:MAG: hypothetical protein QF858_04100 [Candidatus Pacebacteria bacterium]|nr:hypothetical protein [Candidatus Paceibacterota bacterium]